MKKRARKSIASQRGQTVVKERKAKTKNKKKKILCILMKGTSLKLLNIDSSVVEISNPILL